MGMAKEPVSERAPELGDRGTMIDFFRGALADPALRYALAVGALSVVVAIFAAALDLRVAVFGLSFVLIATAILIVISRLAEDRSVNLRNAIYIFVYSAEIILIVTIVFFIVTFFLLPETLHKLGMRSFYEWTGIGPTTAVLQRNARQYITEFDDAVGGAAKPSAVAEAIERVEAFWRQPEQRGILKKYRCDGESEIIFEKSASYVLDNKNLMDDIDTITRYYDFVARCAIAKECDVTELCGYFYNQMDDFQRQYTEYFRTISILEGRNPIKNVRTLIFKNCPQRNEPAPASHEDLQCRSAAGSKEQH
jgi:hypothetical protein